MSKFGFEIEYEQNAADLVHWLYQNTSGLIRTADLHRYHCDCLDCLITSQERGHVPAILRAQRDSSCAGEIVSIPFTSIDDARPVLHHLERGAVEVDAIPGPNAGFHVHVSAENMQRHDLDNSLFEWVRWEEVLTMVAWGRFNYVRSNNMPVRVCLDSTWLQWFRTFEEQGLVSRNADRRMKVLDVIRNHDNSAQYKNAMYSNHWRSDRHCYVSINTRYYTWEFRVWNSTRAAWRMELWIELSRAWMNPAFIALISAYDITYPQTDGKAALAFLAESLKNAGYENAAGLLDKQIHYIYNAAADAPTELTISA